MLEDKRDYHWCTDLGTWVAAHIHPRIDSLATKFLASQSVTPDDHLVTIHFRSEKLPEENEFACCLQKMVLLLEELKQDQPNLKVIIISDIGPLGSTTCGSRIRNMTKILFSKNNLKPVYFNLDKFDLTNEDDLLLAGLTEVTAVSKGNKVILVGGGQFQLTILKRLLGRAQTVDQSPMVHSICSSSTTHHLQDPRKKQKIQFLTVSLHERNALHHSILCTLQYHFICTESNLKILKYYFCKYTVIYNSVDSSRFWDVWLKCTNLSTLKISYCTHIRCYSKHHAEVAVMVTSVIFSETSKTLIVDSPE
jgi:hypothetical protein